MTWLLRIKWRAHFIPCDLRSRYSGIIGLRTVLRGWVIVISLKRLSGKNSYEARRVLAVRDYRVVFKIVEREVIDTWYHL